MKKISRRNFMKSSVKASAGTVLGAGILFGNQNAEAETLGENPTSALLFAQVKLPYAYAALEPKQPRPHRLPVCERSALQNPSQKCSLSPSFALYFVSCRDFTETHLHFAQLSGNHPTDVDPDLRVSQNQRLKVGVFPGESVAPLRCARRASVPAERSVIGNADV